MLKAGVILVLLCVAAGFVHGNEYEHLQESSFADLKNSPAQQFVVFYRSNNPEHHKSLKIVNKAAKKIKAEMPFFQFKICDGEAEVNQAEFKEAGFGPGLYYFTSIPEQGIEKYPHAPTKKMIIRHIRNLYANFEPADVHEYTDDDDFYERLDSGGKPIFMKLYAPWCTHCKALKKPFNILASRNTYRAEFMEVDCTKNDVTKEFCTRNGATSYPVMILFNGENKVKYEKDSRTVIAMEEFLDENITEGSSTSSSKKSKKDKDAADAEDDKPKKNKKKEKKSKASSSDDSSSSNGGALEARIAALEKRVSDLEKQLL